MCPAQAKVLLIIESIFIPKKWRTKPKKEKKKKKLSKVIRAGVALSLYIGAGGGDITQVEGSLDKGNLNVFYKVFFHNQFLSVLLLQKI